MKEWCLGFIVPNGDDEMVLLRKSRTMHIGEWNGLGGKLEDGETAIDAMQREGLEESGFKCNWQLACYLRGVTNGEDWRVFVYGASLSFREYYSLDYAPKFPESDKLYRIRIRDIETLRLAPHVRVLNYICMDKIRYPHVNPVQLTEIPTT